MRNHVAEVVEGLPSAQTFKVHAQMCSELLKFVIRVLNIFPEIESARPRCSSGIDALVLLNNSIVKAKSLLHCCSESSYSSILYLALTGDAILSRCKRSKDLLNQSLSQIQKMVPMMLARKISGIVADLGSAVFHLDPSEEEAGKVLRELLHKYGSTTDSTKEAALATIHTVSSCLRISSHKALLIEKSSIKKLLKKSCEMDPKKRNILLFFLNLLSKYEKTRATEQKDNGSSEHGDAFPFSNPYHLSNEMELRADFRSNKAQIDILSSPVPPEEFKCPLSSRLMYDPVVIASGHTYERMWIQKWFDEGHDYCPKTNEKLSHLSSTSNNGMKDLIMKWCDLHSVSIPDPKIQEALVGSYESSTNSIASLSSFMNDLYFPLDFSNVSLGSSNGSERLWGKMSTDVKPSHEKDLECLSKLGTLPWDAQVENVKRLLKNSDESWTDIPSGKFIQVILKFLKDALDLHDIEAQMTGCQLLFEFMQKHRNTASYFREDEYALLASLLDTEVSKQAICIFEVLSYHQQCHSKLAGSGALIGILNILDSQIPELLEPALKILSNLSSNGDARPPLNPSMLVPKLIPFLGDNSLARYCITILKNSCENEEVRLSIVETEGCIGSISKLLEKENDEDQEDAVSILLSLCSQHIQFCQLVMDEGVIPGLVSISANGNKKARAMAMELLRILNDVSSTPDDYCESNMISVDSTKQCDDKTAQKAPGLFGKIFSKQKKKR